MSPASASASRPVRSTKAPSASEASAGGKVERGQRDQVPQRGRASARSGRGRQAIRRASGRAASRRRGRGERERGGARRAQALQQREMGVAQQRTGEVQGRGQRPAAQTTVARPGSEHRDLQARLDIHQARCPGARAAPGRRCSSAGRRAGRCRSPAPRAGRSRPRRRASGADLERASPARPRSAQSSAAVMPASAAADHDRRGGARSCTPLPDQRSVHGHPRLLPGRQRHAPAQRRPGSPRSAPGPAGRCPPSPARRRRCAGRAAAGARCPCSNHCRARSASKRGHEPARVARLACGPDRDRRRPKRVEVFGGQVHAALSRPRARRAGCSSAAAPRRDRRRARRPRGSSAPRSRRSPGTRRPIAPATRRQ